MTTDNADLATDTGLPAKLDGYLSDLQDEVIQVCGILEGIDLLLEDDRGRNAALTLVSIALDKMVAINRALDSAIWPKAMADENSA